jgi:phenylacetic acid degradation operon negative regulatory protein
MSERHLIATRTLVARFRRARPLRSGSLIVTLLGDAIAPRGGAVMLGSLIRLARPFGLTERLVRTSVARLAQLGWLAARRAGRQSEYHLTALGRRRFAEATQRIYGPNPSSWNGRWTLLLLAQSPRGERERIRSELLWRGYGQLQPGLLAHPDRSAADVRHQLAELGISAVVVMEAVCDTADDQRLVARGWDLGQLARRYARFISHFTPTQRAFGGWTGEGAVDPGLAAAAFTIRTLLIHEYRKIHLRDPQLPAALLPPDWIGGEAYALCRALYRRVFAAAEQFVSAQAHTLSGPLPAPAPDTYERFGGLGN